MVIWWLNLDKEIEKLASSCPACQSSRSLPPVTPLHTWPWPENLWSRIHIDYAGPINNQILRVVVDSFSKWIEVLRTCTESVSKYYNRKAADPFCYSRILENVVLTEHH